MLTRKKIVLGVLSTICCLVLLQGCSTTSTDKKATTSTTEQQADIMPPSDLTHCKNAEQAGKIMIDSVLKGLSEDNYAMYTRDFTSESKNTFTKEIFNDASKAVNNNLGILKTKQYLGFYVKDKFTILLWKATYSKISGDVLFKLYVKKEGNSYKVAAFIPS